MTSSEPLQARYKPLGNSGFRVSVPIVGCMGIGSSKWLPWVLDPEDAAPILKAAYDLGATSWDTANIQILTKCFSYTAKPGTKLTGFLNSTDHTRYSNHMGLSRAATYEQATPIEETMRALHDLVQAGKVHYIGASSMFAYQFSMMQSCAGRVQKVAEKLDWPMADVALAWVQSKVSSPIVGVTSIKRIEAAVAAAHKSLDPEDIAYLEEPYVPRNISGFR
ncbi:NADP-dependent oxidoreductase domain-containing protein [Myxozyma melibiosi]|uniref:NADP-dependent oxidoreductase domain-containing protein n=1 Tax=Myxozyma melibiosi TaxID=54550 RepID=A0ABR1F634_9ASCO